MTKAQSHIDRARDTANKVRELNFAQIEEQNSRMPQPYPSKPKIYKDVVQQTSFNRGLEKEPLAESREVEVDLGLGFGQTNPHYTQDYRSQQREVRPDPADIDADDSEHRFRPDPDSIDDSIPSKDNRMKHQYRQGYPQNEYQYQPQQYEAPEKQDYMKIQPGFLNRSHRNEIGSRSGDEGASDVLDQLSQFEKKFRRDYDDESSRGGF